MAFSRIPGGASRTPQDPASRNIQQQDGGRPVPGAAGRVDQQRYQIPHSPHSPSYPLAAMQKDRFRPGSRELPERRGREADYSYFGESIVLDRVVIPPRPHARQNAVRGDREGPRFSPERPQHTPTRVRPPYEADLRARLPRERIPDSRTQIPRAAKVRRPQATKAETPRKKRGLCFVIGRIFKCLFCCK